MLCVTETFAPIVEPAPITVSPRALERLAKRTAPVHSWYLRLPGPLGSAWAGIVRIECGSELSTDAAVALADVSAATLPRFASTSYKDARAPQNLVPIAGLERRLRALLGDSRLLHRTLVRNASVAAGTSVGPSASFSSGVPA